MTRLDPASRAEAAAAVEEWVSEWQRKAEDGEYVPVLDKNKLEPQILEFADVVLPGIDEYYICRQRECRMLVRNTDWIHNLGRGGGHYLCISCGEQYRPWKMKPGYIKANEVWVAETYGVGEAHLTAAVTGPSEGRGGGGTVTGSSEGPCPGRLAPRGVRFVRRPWRGEPGHSSGYPYRQARVAGRTAGVAGHNVASPHRPPQGDHVGGGGQNRGDESRRPPPIRHQQASRVAAPPILQPHRGDLHGDAADGGAQLRSTQRATVLVPPLGRQGALWMPHPSDGTLGRAAEPRRVPPRLRPRPLALVAARGEALSRRSRCTHAAYPVVAGSSEGNGGSGSSTRARHRHVTCGRRAPRCDRFARWQWRYRRGPRPPLCDAAGGSPPVVAGSSDGNGGTGAARSAPLCARCAGRSRLNVTLRRRPVLSCLVLSCPATCPVRFRSLSQATGVASLHTVISMASQSWNRPAGDAAAAAPGGSTPAATTWATEGWTSTGWSSSWWSSPWWSSARWSQTTPTEISVWQRAPSQGQDLRAGYAYTPAPQPPSPPTTGRSPTDLAVYESPHGGRAAAGSSDGPPPGIRKAAGSSEGPARGRGAAGSSDDPTPGNAIVLRGRQYTCGRCGKGLYKSEALINLKDPSMDWQGDLNITCYHCFTEGKRAGVDEITFRSMAKKAWTERADNAGVSVKRVRDVNFAKARKQIEDRYPGETKKAFRARILQATSHLASAVAAGMLRLDPASRAEAAAAVEEWVAEWQQKAEDGEYVPVLDKNKLEHQILQFADPVFPGIDEYYICRQRECRMLVRNTDLDPQPGARRRPLPLHLLRRAVQAVEDQAGVRQGEQGLGRRDLREWARPHLTAAATGPSEGRGGGVTATGSSEGRAPDGSPPAVTGSSDGRGGASPATAMAIPADKLAWQVVPLVWQDTTSQALTDRLKEIMLGEADKIAAMSPEDRLPYVTSKLAESQHRQYFSRTEVTFTAMQRMADRNSVAPGAPQFSYLHLADKELYGCRIPLTVPLDEPLSQDDFLLVFGLSRWLLWQREAKL